MTSADTELIFPPRLIPDLEVLRGPLWRDLVTSVLDTGPGSHQEIAFVLMMARLNNCATCNADSFRATQGCTACTIQSLKRVHTPDEELLVQFRSIQAEVEDHLQTMK